MSAGHTITCTACGATSIAPPQTGVVHVRLEHEHACPYALAVERHREHAYVARHGYPIQIARTGVAS